MTRQMVPRCLVSTDKIDCVNVPMTNLLENDFILSKGDTITRGILSR